MSRIFLDGVGTSTASSTIRGVPILVPVPVFLGGVDGRGGVPLSRSSSSDSSASASMVCCRASIVTLDEVAWGGSGVASLSISFFLAGGRPRRRVGSGVVGRAERAGCVLAAPRPRPLLAVARVVRAGCGGSSAASSSSSSDSTTTTFCAAFGRRDARVGAGFAGAGCVVARALCRVTRLVGGSAGAVVVAFRFGGMLGGRGGGQGN